MTTKSLKLGEDLVREIELRAKEENRTFSGYVRNVLAQAVRERDATEEEKRAIAEYYRDKAAGEEFASAASLVSELESE